MRTTRPFLPKPGRFDKAGTAAYGPPRWFAAAILTDAAMKRECGAGLLIAALPKTAAAPATVGGERRATGHWTEKASRGL
jgi:hypothetical protein